MEGDIFSVNGRICGYEYEKQDLFRRPIGRIFTKLRKRYNILKIGLLTLPPIYDELRFTNSDFKCCSQTSAKKIASYE